MSRQHPKDDEAQGQRATSATVVLALGALGFFAGLICLGLGVRLPMAEAESLMSTGAAVFAVGATMRLVT